MKLFLSWSGPKSRAVATALHEWLTDVVHGVEPFMSETDIDKGAVGVNVISEHLDATSFGIICLTQANMERPWLNYEAGALSKSVGDDTAHVATLLIDIHNPTDVTGPLGKFQATRLNNQQDMHKLVRDIAKQAGDRRPAEKLNNVVDRFWEPLQNALGDLEDIDDGPKPPERGDSDKIDEILQILRKPPAISSSYTSLLPNLSEMRPSADYITVSGDGQLSIGQAKTQNTSIRIVTDASRSRVGLEVTALVRALGLPRNIAKITTDLNGTTYIELNKPVTPEQYDAIAGRASSAASGSPVVVQTTSESK